MIRQKRQHNPWHVLDQSTTCLLKWKLKVVNSVMWKWKLKKFKSLLNWIVMRNGMMAYEWPLFVSDKIIWVVRAGGLPEFLNTYLKYICRYSLMKILKSHLRIEATGDCCSMVSITTQDKQSAWSYWFLLIACLCTCTEKRTACFFKNEFSMSTAMAHLNSNFLFNVSCGWQISTICLMTVSQYHAVFFLVRTWVELSLTRVVTDNRMTHIWHGSSCLTDYQPSVCFWYDNNMSDLVYACRW